MGLILIRYGEIGLKGQNRSYFLRRLRRNLRQSLKACDVEGRVWQDGQRLYITTSQVEQATDAGSRVFGVVSLSPVSETRADLDAVTEEATALALRAGLNRSGSFRVSARRADKAFPLISPEIERRVGAEVVAVTGARVDLSRNADMEIGVEIQPGRALVYGQVIAGPGGLPLGSQGKVVALLSSGIDSPVATWLMMKRGCSVIPLTFSAGHAQEQQVMAILDALGQHSYGWRLKPVILSHQEVLGPTLARLRDLRRERWTCLFCKRAMMAKAADIADELGAQAIVTGDSLGQVASQTLQNLEVISYGVQKPILRPLIGLDKTEIVDLARRIGTYEASTKTSVACPFLPDGPLTRANVAKLRQLLQQLSETDSEESP